MTDNMDQNLEDMVGAELEHEQKIEKYEILVEIREIILVQKEERRLAMKRIEDLNNEKETLKQRIVEIEDALEKEMLLTNNRAPTTNEESNVNLELLDFIDSEIQLKEAELECPVCLETADEPIFQCSSGHLLCSICIARVKICPVCRVRLGDTPQHCRYAQKILQVKILLL